VHTRDVDGRTLSFGHSGWLWKDSFLLYDRETDSLWHHLWGRALSGSLRGKSLRRLPVAQTTFAAWRREHPETLVLPKPLDPQAPMETDAYARRTSRLRLGVGIEVGAERRLYPLAALRAAGVVEEEVAGVPVAVAADPACSAAFAYDRRVGGVAVSLELGDERGRPVLVERGGGRRWSLRSGRPVPEEDAHPPLRTLLSSPWDAAAWKGHHPSGSTWDAASEAGAD
jgi:hypothetical protein